MCNGEDFAADTIKVAAAVFIANLLVAVRTHHAKASTKFDALGPVPNVVAGRIRPIENALRSTESQTPPEPDTFAIDVDLPPRRLDRRDVIAECDVASVTDDVDEVRLRER